MRIKDVLADDAHVLASRRSPQAEVRERRPGTNASFQSAHYISVVSHRLRHVLATLFELRAVFVCHRIEWLLFSGPSNRCIVQRQSTVSFKPLRNITVS